MQRSAYVSKPALIPNLIPEQKDPKYCIIICVVNILLYKGEEFVTGNLPVHFENVKAQTYDSNMNPACQGNMAELRLPGIIKLVSGDIKVDKQLILQASGNALMTLTKKSFLIGTLCDNGKSKNALIPDKDCNVDICTVLGDTFCTLLDTPGVHTIDELEHMANVTNIIHLPQLSNGIEGLLKGEWQMQMNLQSNEQTIGHIKLPGNEQWM